VTTQQPRSRRRLPLLNAVAAATENRVYAYPAGHTASDGTTDIAEAALQSHDDCVYLAEHLVPPHLPSAVSVCAAVDSRGSGSSAGDAEAGLKDGAPLLQDASR
jgi:hypothetical protein